MADGIGDQRCGCCGLLEYPVVREPLLREGRPPTVSGEDGRAAVAMVEACYRSSQTGQAVTLAL